MEEKVLKLMSYFALLALLVWAVASSLGKRDQLTPTFYSVIENTNAVVIAQPEMVSGLAENPQAQLNLISFCQMALRPELLRLPAINGDP